MLGHNAYSDLSRAEYRVRFLRPHPPQAQPRPIFDSHLKEHFIQLLQQTALIGSSGVWSRASRIKGLAGRAGRSLRWVRSRARLPSRPVASSSPCRGDARLMRRGSSARGVRAVGPRSPSLGSHESIRFARRRRGLTPLVEAKSRSVGSRASLSYRLVATWAPHKAMRTRCATRSGSSRSRSPSRRIIQTSSCTRVAYSTMQRAARRSITRSSSSALVSTEAFRTSSSRTAGGRTGGKAATCA